MHLIFSAPIETLTEKINVTEFNRIIDYVNDVNDSATPQTQSEIGVTYDIFTTTEVEIGTQWDFSTDKESISDEPAESGKFDLSITNIPEEIRNKYPDLNIDKIEYSKTYLNLHEVKYENVISKEGITIYQQ